MKFEDVTDIVNRIDIRQSRKEFFAHCKKHGLTNRETKQEYNRLKDKRNRVWQNDKYIVHTIFPDDRDPLGWIHLSIRNVDGSAKHDWREFQDIKNSILGKEYEGIELYPAESRVLDECNQFHIYCAPKGEVIPCGRADRRVSWIPRAEGTYQRDRDGNELRMIDGKVVENNRARPLAKPTECA